MYKRQQLWGATSIGDNAVIGPDTTLTDMTVGRGASVIRTHGERSAIGEDATLVLDPGNPLFADIMKYITQ